MQTYPINRGAIHRKIKQKYPDSLPTIDEIDPPGYILWMMDQLVSFSDQGKIDRWIGCIQGMAYMLNLFEFDELRDLTRRDLGK